jgi:crossover junction endodeoxyribonuclease RuvC
MKILGIDPGSVIIGYGIIEVEGNHFSALDHGILDISGNNALGSFLEARKSLQHIIKEYRPDRAAVEKLFFAKNQKTAIAVSQMRGVLLFSLTESRIPIFEFTPLQVKQAVCGYGLANKKQIETVVRKILSLSESINPDDAADALAVAVCCAVSPNTVGIPY